MSIKIADGAKENGIFIGNYYDKYGSCNPIIRWMMNGFKSTLSDLIVKASPKTIYEIGCGEGYWVLHWNETGLVAKGCDFSKQAIQLARENAIIRNLNPSLFEVRSIYDLDARNDSADLIVCCEVLEHLDNPEAGLQALQRVVERHLIVSVPQEPLWRALNLARGRYISRWGNTPGHIQHWSKRTFVKLISSYFQVIEVRSPLPWTMLLCRHF